MAAKQQKTRSINRCGTCFGFGIWEDDFSPVYECEAREGVDTERCPECGEDNSYYADLDDAYEYHFKSSDKDDFDTILTRFELRLKCAESLDMQESPNPIPW